MFVNNLEYSFSFVKFIAEKIGFAYRLRIFIRMPQLDLARSAAASLETSY